MGKSKNRILECYLCKSVMKCNKVSNLRRHIRLHGPLVQCFECLECGIKFQNKSNLKTHWSKKHSNSSHENEQLKMIVTSRPAKRRFQQK